MEPSQVPLQKVLLVSIAIGAEYNKLYSRIFKKSQQEYAKKCKYDFLVLNNFIDMRYQQRAAISFHKILTCSQPWASKYDFVIFVDADIFINSEAPSIHNYIEYGDKMGVVDEFSQPTLEKRIAIQQKNGWETSATDHYKLAGFDLETPHVFNSGMLVMQPKYHAALCQQIFDTYIERALTSPRGFIYEQDAIGYELHKQNKYVLLPHKFNAIWSLAHFDNPSLTVYDFYKENYFIHFAGCFYKDAEILAAAVVAKN
jgi:hypothetical protein